MFSRPARPRRPTHPPTPAILAPPQGITPSGAQWVYFDTCASLTMLAAAVNVTHAAVEHVHDLISPTTGLDLLTKLSASQAAFRASVVIFTANISVARSDIPAGGVLVSSEMHFMGSPAGQLVGLDMGMQVSFMRLQNNLSVVYITDLQVRGPGGADATCRS